MRLRLKHFRNERGLTLAQLAEISGLSRGFLSQLENQRRRPGPDTIDILSRTLGVPAAALVEDDQGNDLASIIDEINSLSPGQKKAVRELIRSFRSTSGA